MIETSDKGPRSLHGDDSSNRKTDSQKDTRRHNWHIIVIIHVINSEKGFISDQSSKYS